MTALIPIVASSSSVTTSDFETYEINGCWHWEGLGVYADYCSEDGFEDLADCINDAIAFLQSIDDGDDSTPDFSALAQ